MTDTQEKPRSFEPARSLLIEHAQAAEKRLTETIAHGHRNWTKAQGSLDEYRALLTASDTLADLELTRSKALRIAERADAWQRLGLPQSLAMEAARVDGLGNGDGFPPHPALTIGAAKP